MAHSVFWFISSLSPLDFTRGDSEQVERVEKWSIACPSEAPTYIGFIEQGRRNPTILNIYKISKALKIPLKDIFSNL